VAVGIDKQKFDLVTDQRLDTGVGERRFDAAERSAAAAEYRRAILLEELARRPSQSVADDVQRGQVNPDALITDDTDVLGERDTGLVDGEAMPNPAGAHAWLGECVGPAYRYGLGQGEAGRIHHRADDRVDPFGLELGDRGGGERCGGHLPGGPGASDPTRQRQLAGLADIQGAQYPSHAHPQRAGHGQVGE